MENTPLQMERRIQQLERRMVVLAAGCGVLAIGLSAAIMQTHTAPVKAAEDAKVLRVKGLVIDDEQGRARILLGAPFPKTPDRLRQDDGSAAMVFLDNEGHDRFLVGETIGAQIGGKVPQQFHRIGQSSAYGATIFDAAGNERGGMGFLSNGNTVNRAVVALDRPGEDAVGMMVDDKTGYAGLGINYPREVREWTTGVDLGTQGNKAFITIRDSHDMPRATLGIGPAPIPSLQVFDEKGNPETELLSTKPAKAAN